MDVPSHMTPVRILHFDTPEGWRLLQTEPASMPTPRMIAATTAEAAEAAWDAAWASARQTPAFTPVAAPVVPEAAPEPVSAVPTAAAPTTAPMAPTTAPTTAPTATLVPPMTAPSTFMAHDISRVTDADLTSLRQAARVFIDRLETEQHIRRRRGTVLLHFIY